MDATNVAIPEALLNHGLSVAEGRHLVDILECDSSFIRAVIADKHGVAMGADALPSVNDRLLNDGTNRAPRDGRRIRASAGKARRRQLAS